MHTHKIDPRPVLRCLLAAAGLSPALAGALGLGDIQVKSALSQPFEAEIAVVQDRPGEAELASVALASAAAFGRAGMERRFFLSGLRFSFETHTDGKPYVRVRSDGPVREPYLDFLVEVVWPAGTLLRQYTVLLDPPTRPWAALVTPEVAQSVVPARTQRAPASAAAARGAVTRSDPFANVAAPVAGSTYGPVRPGDTLWAIAARARPVGVSMSQAMYAILRANPEAFIGGSPQRMMAGSRLVIPDAAALAATGFADAKQAMAAHIPGWAQRAEPEAPAAQAPAPDAIPARAPEASGALERHDAATADTAAPAVGGELKLVQAEPGVSAPPDTPATAGAVGGDTRLQLLEESLDSSRQENAALRERLERLEAQMAQLAATATPTAGASADDAGRGDAVPAGAPGGVPPGVTAPSEPREGGRGPGLKMAVAAAGLIGGVGYLVARRLRRAAPAADTLAAGSMAPASAPAAKRMPAVSVTEVPHTGSLPGTDAVASDLDLLAALVAGGDAAGARELHAAILARGDASQRAQASALLAHLQA